MSRRSLVLAVLCGVFLLAYQNCGQLSNRLHVQDGYLNGTASGNPPQTDGSKLVGFAQVYQRVFEPSCIRCHSGEDEIRYSSYADTIGSGKLKVLHESYQQHKEPDKECGTIDSEAMDLIVTWIEQGAPE